MTGRDAVAWALLAVFLAALVLAVVGNGEDVDYPDKAVCTYNLKQIGMYGALYAAEYGQLPPPTGRGWFEAIIDTGIMPPEDYHHLACGVDDVAEEARENTSGRGFKLERATCSYLARTVAYSSPPSPDDILVCDRSASFHGDVVQVLRGDLRGTLGVDGKFTDPKPQYDVWRPSTEDGDPLEWPPLQGVVGW